MTTSLLDAMLAASRAGSEVLLDHFARVAELSVIEKGPADFVSVADTTSEEAIRRVLAAARPDVPFVGEETSAGRVVSGPRFLVDPLDGTTNFLRGIPHFAVSIAYVDDEGPWAGVVADPCKGETFFAERGHGAWLESARGRRALPRLQARELEGAVIHTGVPHRGRGNHAQYLRQLEKVMAEVSGVRRMGAAALDLAYVAAGRGDGFFELGLHPWDVAAGMAILAEVGALVTDFGGIVGASLVNGEVVAGPPGLHDELRAWIREA